MGRKRVRCVERMIDLAHQIILLSTLERVREVLTQTAAERWSIADGIQRIVCAEKNLTHSEHVGILSNCRVEGNERAGRCTCRTDASPRGRRSSGCARTRNDAIPRIGVGHIGDEGSRQLLAQTFIVHEEKCFVFADGSSDRTSKLMPVKRRCTRGVEEVPRIEYVVAIKLIPA